MRKRSCSYHERRNDDSNCHWMKNTYQSRSSCLGILKLSRVIVCAPARIHLVDTIQILLHRVIIEHAAALR